MSAPDTAAPQLRASLVIIGDEILGGFVRDTNSGWLAARLQSLGVPLERIVTVPDDLEAIDEALRAELARPRPRVVFTSGGIGSTPDDVTMEAVAATLGMGLRVEADIDERITRMLSVAAASGSPVSADHERSVRKMALVPAAAYLLPRVEALAPGVAVDVDGGSGADAGVTLVVLPGIPSEFERIVEEGVEPVLLAGRGRPEHVAELRHAYPESLLNPVLDRVVEAFPDVRVGSYPGWECTVRLRGPHDRVEAAMAEVRAFLDDVDAEPGAAALRHGWQSRWTPPT